ncbi:MAG TPA: hypothetical protein PKM25_12185 [Candidatus Ozemobacteraceae bacterium]|nr:hypothetical protein [Candidatus Ozemobacteraceae bacterium]
MQNKFRTKEERRRYWHDHVITWRKSGLSQKNYSSLNRIHHKSLGYWSRKFPRHDFPLTGHEQQARSSTLLSPASEVKFIPVAKCISPLQSEERREKLILRIGRRFRIDIPETFSAASLANLVRVLEKLN